MALASVDALAGYLLEEAIAYLLRSNGYRLLESAAADEQALRNAPNGLVVRGRGADHQADALGELLVPSPFSLPVRLFVEGKNRRAKVDLKDVRNAHGVIDDVNEHYSAAQALAYRQPLRRHQYRYALFSASGFRSEAQGYALAHQISLVDLSGPAFEPLVLAVREAAETLRARASALELTRFPVRKVRVALRAALAAVESEMTAADSAADAEASNTSPADAAAAAVSGLPSGLPNGFLSKWAAQFAATLNATASGEGLLLGFPPAPFILAMRPDSILDFEAYVAEHGPDVEVSIGFDGDGSVDGDWVISPLADPDGFRLSFGIPGALETWLLSAPDRALERAAEAKQELLSSISLFLEDRLVRLLFAPVAVPLASARDTDDELFAVNGEATDASQSSYLRRTLKPPRRRESARDMTYAPSGTLRPPVHEGVGWSLPAVAELMRELDEYNYVQGQLVRQAARNGGVLTREDVYRIAEFRSDRSLRGLTRPPRRITGSLVKANLLPEDAPYPFQARYASGVRATHFVVPPDVVAALRDLGPPLGI